jgi:hypothetical protein
VIGTLYYLDESVICRSAVHAGIIDGSKGGKFEMVIVNGQEFY